MVAVSQRENRLATLMVLWDWFSVDSFAHRPVDQRAKVIVRSPKGTFTVRALDERKYANTG